MSTINSEHRSLLSKIINKVSYNLLYNIPGAKKSAIFFLKIGHKLYPNDLQLQCNLLAGYILVGREKDSKILFKKIITENPNYSSFKDVMNSFCLKKDYYLITRRLIVRKYQHNKILNEIKYRHSKISDKTKYHLELPLNTLKQSQYFIDVPKFINKPVNAQIGTQKAQVIPPKIYMAYFENVRIFGGTDLVVHNNQCLYDEIENINNYKFGLKSRVIEKIGYHKLHLKFYVKARTRIDEAIHFCKDHSLNYFHWLIECLPRYFIVEAYENLNHLPLLIDADLYPQQLEALEILTQGKRDFIHLEKNISYKINKLYYPSQLSEMHDNYDKEIRVDKDVVYSQEGLQQLRNYFLNAVLNNDQDSPKKIFIARKSTMRNLANSDEIQKHLEAQGFITIRPEKLTFKEQVSIFANADVIVGQSGAGMANLIFCKPTCKIFMLMNDHAQTNYYYFHVLLNLVGLSLYYIIGDDVINQKDFNLHNDFSVSIKWIDEALKQM